MVYKSGLQSSSGCINSRFRIIEIVFYQILSIHRKNSETIRNDLLKKKRAKSKETTRFIRFSSVMTLLAYSNEENRTNRVFSLFLARNSFDPFRLCMVLLINRIYYEPVLSLCLENHKICMDFFVT